MAPRIRLNIAKPLPTISEALEDIFEDATGNIKHSYSGEDYLQSVCKQARPSLPATSESKIKCQDIEKMARLHGTSSILSMHGATKMVPWDEVNDTLPNFSSFGGTNFILNCIQNSSGSLGDLYTEAQRTQVSQCPNCRENVHFDCPQENLCNSGQDDDTDLGSSTRLSSLKHVQKEDSWSELKILKNQNRMSALKHGPNQKENAPLDVHGKSIWLHSAGGIPMGAKISKSSPRGQLLPRVACTERLNPAVCNQNAKGKVSNGRGCVGNIYRDPKVTSRDWISEYQSAWKEARVKAALLPSISES